MFIDFKERGRKREREKHRCERETSILPHAPQPGVQPATWIHVLSRDWISVFWCMGWCSNQLNHPARVRAYHLLSRLLHLILLDHFLSLSLSSSLPPSRSLSLSLSILFPHPTLQFSHCGKNNIPNIQLPQKPFVPSSPAPQSHTRHLSFQPPDQPKCRTELSFWSFQDNQWAQSAFWRHVEKMDFLQQTTWKFRH